MVTFSTLEHAFLNVSQNVRYAQRSESYNTKYSHTDLMKHLQEFLRLIKIAPDALKQQLVDIHSIELHKFKSSLKDIKYVHARPYYDHIFTKHLVLHPYLMSGVSRLLQEFIKGITYFKSQGELQTDVIYHRMFSCGPNRDKGEFRAANHVCLKADAKEERKRRGQLIETCYIERLIFNELYKHDALHFPNIGTEIHSQNAAHIERMKLTRDDFMTCFPKEDVSVSVEYRESVPTILVITRTKNGRVNSIERYVREYTKTYGYIQWIYDPFVECYRDVFASNGNVKHFHKYQHFYSPSKWKSDIAYSFGTRKARSETLSNSAHESDNKKFQTVRAASV